MARRIEIVPYDAGWSGEFREIGGAIRDTMGELALRVDHIGSTSVPGLAAKDVIDIQVTVRELDAPAIAAALAPLEYTLHERIDRDHVPPGAERQTEGEWRKLLFNAPAGQRRTHLHVRRAGNANQWYALLFRDYLRASPAAAEAYRRVKEALARLHPDDQAAYYDVKDPVCDLIMDAAERWATSTGYTQGLTDL